MTNFPLIPNRDCSYKWNSNVQNYWIWKCHYPRHLCEQNRIHKVIFVFLRISPVRSVTLCITSILWRNIFYSLAITEVHYAIKYIYINVWLRHSHIQLVHKAHTSIHAHFLYTSIFAFSDFCVDYRNVLYKYTCSYCTDAQARWRSLLVVPRSRLAHVHMTSMPHTIFSTYSTILWPVMIY